MSDYHCHPLPPTQRRLLHLFYRQHGSSMRPSGEASSWVAREREIIAGLCLTPMAGGAWLTSLFVAPLQRGKGVAGALIEAALHDAAGPVWLFCAPELSGFYGSVGFAPVSTLPEALSSRLQRYQRSKPLIAMRRDLAQGRAAACLR
ncbi:GNAT family N-acetyltransferase [Pseudomonas sp.]|uniref:GNAT family N-acetyltransferase n=1 Tax=Pseudomonas sp. TaxID=306 RepID=UPI0028ACABB4|nr:GNAT family N-acetyltransferase [Pseudomonas sp.]